MAFKNNIIDCSHYQVIKSFDEIKDDGIELMIHKATEGNFYYDKKYGARKKGCADAGIKFGAYHFLKADGKREAERFVNFVDDDILLALDYEDINIPVQEAERFVETVFNLTGKYPLLYSFHSLLYSKKFNANSILGNCMLWAARYGKSPVIPSIWKGFSIWQYTDKGIVKGIQGFCDKNFLNEGLTVAELIGDIGETETELQAKAQNGEDLQVEPTPNEATQNGEIKNEDG